MDTKLFGGILLVIGTAIGAGMLALPIANSQTGFLYSSILLFICWFIMTSSALLILEINLWLDTNSNIISMAKTTLGPIGQIIAWVSYLVLLYALLSAYMAGGADFLDHLLAALKINIPNWSATILFTAVLSVIVYQGIRSVDYVNRGLMITKFSTLVVLLLLIIPLVSSRHLAEGNIKYFTTSTTVAITSFGFANIIPSLRAYFHSDAVKLRKAILIGSCVPLFCYILWDLAIMGTIPRSGDNGLISMAQSGRSTSEFVTALSHILQKDSITTFARIFTSICLATSFLGVALSMTDFLADGLQVKKEGWANFGIYLLTFIPPLIIVLFYPGIFIKALSYAGIDCMLLLVILPVLMAWRGRYYLQFHRVYQVKGGKYLLIFLLLAGLFVIGKEIF